jgi:Flp pilus assembly protein TadG
VRSPSAAESSRSNATGSVTAEFAVVIPAVAAVLILCVTGVRVESEQLQLQSAAAVAARSSARGDSEAVTSARLELLLPLTRMSFTRRDGMVCAHVVRSPSDAIQSVLGLTLEASSCALANDG